MGRYLLFFSYLGTRYRGVQRNNFKKLDLDLDSIQGAVEAALLTLRPASLISPHFVVSSRTDVGVHALHSAGHVNLINKYDTVYNPYRICYWLNYYFLRSCHDIRILSCLPITDEIHARHSAKSRTYIYRFMVPKDNSKFKNTAVIPISELNRCFSVTSSKFDIEKVKKASEIFRGTWNYQTFAARDGSGRKIQFVRRLQYFNVEEGQPLMPDDPLNGNFDFWQIKCTAKSFLYNQIRRMAGALIAVGKGVITEKDILVMLQVPSHDNWLPQITRTPPEGLYLTRVEYDKEELEKNTIKYEDNKEDEEDMVTPKEMSLETSKL